MPGLILSALSAGNQPLTWQDSSAETAYKELITHIHRYKAPGTGESGMPARKRGRSSYYQWSSKAEGKTITRTLTEDEAKLYQEWIENDRKLRSILKEMRRASEHATQLILKQKVK